MLNHINPHTDFNLLVNCEKSLLLIFSVWQDEKKLRDALLFANACGAVTVTERGAIPAMPTKEAVLQILAKNAG